jgi:hypothetical protein
LIFFKNGGRELRKHLIVTTLNVVFIDYQGFSFNAPRCYRDKDIIRIAEIISVRCEMKDIYMTNRPFLEVVTIKGDSYGVAFSSFGNYKDEMNDIADYIKSANHEVKTIIEITEMPWKK